MKSFFITGLALISFSSYGSNMTCEEAISALVFDKMQSKAMARGKLSNDSDEENWYIDCRRLDDGYYKELLELKKEKLRLCRLSQEKEGLSEFERFDPKKAGSKSDFIKNVFDIKNDPCLIDLATNRFGSIIDQIRASDNMKKACANLESTYRGYLDRINYCENLGEAGNDPNTCEIAGPDGRCPGAPDPVATPSTNNQRSQSQKFIHWGKVKKSKASAR